MCVYMQERPFFRKHTGFPVMPGCAGHVELALGCMSRDTQQFVYIRETEITGFQHWEEQGKMSPLFDSRLHRVLLGWGKASKK